MVSYRAPLVFDVLIANFDFLFKALSIFLDLFAAV